MTNPTEPRWIPAAEKEGGLVFGDVVRPTSVKNGQYAFLSIVHINMMPYYRAAGFAGTIYNWPTEHTDLLVRLDPPAQLPESTDGELILWDAYNTDCSLPTSSPDEAAIYIADLDAPEFGPHIVRIEVARRLPDIFAVVNYDHDKGEWKCVSEHSSHAEADAAKATLPAPTEAADGE